MTDVSALRRLRLRTPRLELRLGDRSELEALAHVAAAGIHPPHEMPFAVPCTDAIDEPGFVDDFVAFHEQAIATWTPESWTLNLLAFVGSAPLGTQAVSATRFSAERTVMTGSWLGTASQGRGLGTAVSARLGYRDGNARRAAAWRARRAPRSRPRVGAWRCPVAVELVDAEACLPLFGASSA